MTKPLTEWLSNASGDGGLRLWLQSSAYTRRLLLGAADADPWESAASYLAYFSQAHGLLKADVAVVEVGELFAASAVRAGGLADQLGKRVKPTTALRKLLESETAQAILSEVLEAVSAHLRGQAPLVISIPSPHAWMLQANQLAGVDTAIELDDAEDAAMYVADLMRSVSTQPISGVLLTEADDEAWTPELLQRYRSVINVAHHYHWSLALRLPKAAQPEAAALGDFDIAIAQAGQPVASEMGLGIDVSSHCAQALQAEAAPDVPTLAARQFYFSDIDPNAQPEAVLELVKNLRA